MKWHTLNRLHEHAISYSCAHFTTAFPTAVQHHCVVKPSTNFTPQTDAFESFIQPLLEIINTIDLDILHKQGFTITMYTEVTPHCTYEEHAVGLPIQLACNSCKPISHDHTLHAMFS